MIRTDSSVGMLKAIAMIAGLAILLWSLGLPSLRLIEAANVSSFSDTLSDSAPGVAADHTIQFTATDGLAAGETMVITFPFGFNLGSVDETDIELDVNSSSQTVAAAAAAGVWGVVASGQTITFTSNDTTIGAGEVVDIRIGIDNTASGDQQITNPSAEGSYEIDLGGTMSDSGSTRVVILTAVTVSATVDTIFTFAVDGTTAGTAVNGDTTTGNTSSTSIPFGTLTDASATTSAQQLTVNTNAANGYVVTIQLDGALRSSTGEDIDGFQDGSDIDTPIPWVDPAGTLGSPNTYGHWGFTTDDATTTRSAGDEFDLLEYAAASTSERVVMSHDGPVNGVGMGVGTTTVGYKVRISALQAAGDYSTTLTYVATPTF